MPSAELIAFGALVRVRAVDSLVEELCASGGIDTIINIGAGLDTRPYRLALPASLRWFELGLASESPARWWIYDAATKQAYSRIPADISRAGGPRTIQRSRESSRAARDVCRTRLAHCVQDVLVGNSPAICAGSRSPAIANRNEQQPQEKDFKVYLLRRD